MQRTASQGNDPFLLGIARHNPFGTLKFLKSAVWTNCFSSAVTCLIIGVILRWYWPCCESCERPFEVWLLVHGVLQGVGLALRLIFLLVLRPATNAGTVDLCVTSLTNTHAWRVNKALSLATYAWVALGSVWVANGIGGKCPALYWCTAGAVAHALVRVALVHSMFEAVEQEAQVTAAEPEEIKVLPITTFNADKTDDPDHSSCAVCLADYADGDKLRHLPCGHHFHTKCADRWLRRNKRCPLCMQSIDSR